MKKKRIIMIIGLLSLILILGAGCSAAKPSPAPTDVTPPTTSGSAVTPPDQGLGADTDKDGLPDSVEVSLQTNQFASDTDGDGLPDKTDKDPIYTDNLIKETSTTALPVKITDARVEDNLNAKDHLEITLSNTGSAELKNFDIYYTVVDTVTKVKEGYYLKLTGFSIKAGETKTLHFDNGTGAGHYTMNLNALYGTSKNEVLFSGQLHAAGSAPMSFSAIKAKGTAEVAD